MNLLANGPAGAKDVLVLAHGAGGAMDTPFMNKIAEGVASRGVRVVRFEFPYMAARRTGQKKRGAPDRQPVLLESWRGVIAELGGGPGLVIGGKSLGGRIASMVADETHARGLVCLGYPFHPPGQPDKLRTAHLAALQTPALIVQGERDAFGAREEIAGYDLAPAIRLEWMPGGDHSWKPRAHSGSTEKGNLDRGIQLISNFVTELD